MRTETETKNGKKAADLLRNWLHKEGNSEAKAAYLLRFKSSATISMWLSRGCVPSREIDNVHKLIKGELK